MLVRFVPILGTTHSFLIDFTSHLTITPSPPPLKIWVESRENSRASIGRECQCPSEYWFSPFQILTLPDSSPLAKNLSLVCGHLRHVIGRFFWFPASFRDHKEDPFVPGTNKKSINIIQSRVHCIPPFWNSALYLYLNSQTWAFIRGFDPSCFPALSYHRSWISDKKFIWHLHLEVIL